MQILKFSSVYCAPCRNLAKQLEGIDLPIQSIDVDEEEELVSKYNIRNIPVLVYIDDEGNELKRLVGAVSKQTIIDTYNELRNSNNS